MGDARRKEVTVQRHGLSRPLCSREAYVLLRDAARARFCIVDSKPFECPDCPHKFGRENMLQGHVRLAHWLRCAYHPLLRGGGTHAQEESEDKTSNCEDKAIPQRR